MSDAVQAADQLHRTLGLSGPELRFGLPQDELFREAIANDRGGVSFDGPSDAQKAFATALGVDGPLVFYTDPACAGRPVEEYATHASFCGINKKAMFTVLNFVLPAKGQLSMHTPNSA